MQDEQKIKTYKPMRNCPGCGHDDVQNVRVAWESGTTDVARVTDSVGIGYAGKFGVGVSRGFSIGTDQDRFTQRLAPPMPQAYGGSVILMLTAVVFALFVEGGLRWASLAFALLLMLSIIPRVRYNNDQHWRDVHNWSVRWVCRRCGEVWEPR